MNNLAFVGNNNHSGYIRAAQLGEYLSAPVLRSDSPLLANFTCVYIKCIPSHGGGYVDVLDGIELRDALKGCRHLGIIAFTAESRQYLARYLGRDDIVYIPQHHCNFDRQVRPSRDVRTVGFVGSKSSLSFEVEGKWSGRPQWQLEEVGNRLADVGLDFRYLKMIRGRPTLRQEVVDLYNNIDIQVFFRSRVRHASKHFKDSLKLINAGSYRIPTVGDAIQTGLAKTPGVMVTCGDIEGLVSECVRLRDDPIHYSAIVDAIYPHTENYHISRIAPLYLKL